MCAKAEGGVELCYVGLEGCVRLMVCVWQLDVFASESLLVSEVLTAEKTHVGQTKEA